ncbi:MAG: hypothetical protein QM699_15235 [Amaricoccus sp.]|uniref:hypothetical protein n=1 Tax=Amaricoccus sp. TaxID=1872485 RepID=UPI0039E615F3
MLVTKGDLGAPAQRAAADVRRALGYGSDGGAAPVAIVSAQAGTGLAEALDLLAGLGREGDGRATRRQEQGRAWMRSRLVESFGREGAGVLEARLAAIADPFATFAELHGRARAAVHASLKNV